MAKYSQADLDLVEEMYESSYVSTWKSCIAKISNPILKARMQSEMQQAIRCGELE